MQLQKSNEKSIYHEKQRSNLCGLHALNSALQGPVFTEHMLKEIAEDLFNQEKALLFLETAVQNRYCDEAGNYSVEVLSNALNLKNIEMRRCNVASLSASDKAYIVHRNEHWFTLRKFGDQGVDLNSLKNQPSLIERCSVQEYINALKGLTTVFVLEGDLEEHWQPPKKKKGS